MNYPVCATEMNPRTGLPTTTLCRPKGEVVGQSGWAEQPVNAAEQQLVDDPDLERDAAADDAAEAAAVAAAAAADEERQDGYPDTESLAEQQAAEQGPELPHDIYLRCNGDGGSDVHKATAVKLIFATSSKIQSKDRQRRVRALGQAGSRVQLNGDTNDEGAPMLQVRDPFATVAQHPEGITLVLAVATKLQFVNDDGKSEARRCLTTAELAQPRTAVTGKTLAFRLVDSEWQWDGNPSEDAPNVTVAGRLVQCLSPTLIEVQDAMGPSSSADAAGGGVPASRMGYSLPMPDVNVAFEQLVMVQQARKQRMHVLLRREGGVLPYIGCDGQAAYLVPLDPLEEPSAAAAPRQLPAQKEVKCTARACGRLKQVRVLFLQQYS